MGPLGVREKKRGRERLRDNGVGLALYARCLKERKMMGESRTRTRFCSGQTGIYGGLVHTS